MEKRKSKILAQVDAINEEKIALIDNVNTIFLQVSSASKYAQSTSYGSKQMEILTYELEVLKDLSEINFKLEKLAEANPIGFQLPEAEYNNNQELSSISGNSTYITPAAHNEPESASQRSNNSIVNLPCTENIVERVMTQIQDLLASSLSPNMSMVDNSVHQRLPEVLQASNREVPELLNDSYLPDYESSSSEPEPENDITVLMGPSSDHEVPVRDTARITDKTNNLPLCDSELFIKSEITSSSGEGGSEPVDCRQSEPDGSTETDRSLNIQNSFESRSNLDKNSNSSIVSEKILNYANEKRKIIREYNCQPLQVPDIKLKSLVTGKSGNTDGLSGTCGKKKNKKKRKEVETANIVLRPKEFPKIGDSCLFSHIISPSEFYIHIVDDDTQMIDVRCDQMNKYFHGSLSAYNSKETAHNLIGHYSAVYIQEYDSWYRCHILNWYLEKKTDEVYVHLVDYGNKCLTSYKNLRKLSKDMASYPMLAIKCYFPLLYPPGSTHLSRKKEWPMSSIEALTNIGTMQENQDEIVFIIEFALPNYEANALAVDMVMSGPTTEDDTVGQILLNLRFAEQLTEPVDYDNMELEAFISDIHNLENARNINEAVAGYDAKDEARICRFTKADGTCFKGQNCKLEHAKLSKDGLTTDQEAVFRGAMYDLILPVLNEIVTILITGFLDNSKFYAQIVRTPYSDPQNNYIMDKNMHTLLTEMNSKGVIKTYEQFRILPAIGEVVIVRHWSNQWLRAIIRSSLENEQDELCVFTVDYGESLKVKFTDLRKIRAEFLKLPFQAVICYLADYKIKEGCNHQTATEFFYETMYLRNFIAEVLSSDEPVKINLQCHNGVDIGQKLLERGYIEPYNKDVHIKDNSVLSPF